MISPLVTCAIADPDISATTEQISSERAPAARARIASLRAPEREFAGVGRLRAKGASASLAVALAEARPREH